MLIHKRFLLTPVLNWLAFEVVKFLHFKQKTTNNSYVFVSENSFSNGASSRGLQNAQNSQAVSFSHSNSRHLGQRTQKFSSTDLNYHQGVDLKEHESSR